MAVEVHIHVMTGLYKADALPISPTPGEIEAVENKYSFVSPNYLSSKYYLGSKRVVIHTGK